MPGPEPMHPPTVRRWGWLARWGLALCAVVYVVTAMGSALDRVSEKTLAAQAVVPAPFRAHADIAAARLAINAGQTDAGLAAAARAIRARPIDAAPPSLLGTALLLRNDAARADASFRVAAAAGWRDPMTQVYWADQSIRAGDWDLAASRIDAILRANPRLPGIDKYRAPLENDPRGLEALARLVARHPPWLQSYLSVDIGMAVPDLLKRASVMERAATIAGPVGCDASMRLTQTLLDVGEGIAADRVTRAHCPKASGLADLASPGEGAGYDGDGDPFGWRLMPGGDVRLAVGEAGDTLEVENLAPTARLVATRPYRVAGGATTLRWDARDADGNESARLDISLDCGTPQRPPFAGELSRAVVAGDCAVGTLGIWVASGSGPVTIGPIRADAR